MEHQNYSISSSLGMEGRSCPDGPSRLSFGRAKQIASCQVEAQYVPMPDRGLASDILSIMAEVMILRDDIMISIGGEMIDGYVVKQVFEQINHESFLKVIHDYKAQTRLIKNKRAYLRTSLYNAVFETEAVIVNEVECEMATL